MKCAEIRKLLSDYSVGGVAVRVKSEIERHLETCAVCSTELAKLRNVTLLLDNLQTMEPPAGLWNGVYNRITGHLQPESAWQRAQVGLRRRARALSLGFATSVLAVILLVARVYQPDGESSYAANEFIQGHASYASQEFLADPAALNSVAAIAYREHVEGMDR